MKKLLRNVLRSRSVQLALGFLAAEYLRLVWLTTKFTFDPPDDAQRIVLKELSADGTKK